MFRPRHAYKSPINKRYRGKTRGCPVFNNILDINSDMVELHDQCLECLAKIKNRTEIYRTLASNKKPNNNVIKSLQKMSSSASNNRLKTCLQFLTIKVNETKIAPINKQNQKNITRSTSNISNHTSNIVETDIVNGNNNNNSNNNNVIDNNHYYINNSNSILSCTNINTSIQPSPSTLLPTPGVCSELKGPRLKLSEEKIRRILRRPMIFDEFESNSRSNDKGCCSSGSLGGDRSSQSTPTTSSDSSPRQSSILSNSEMTKPNITMCHMFQAPAKFVNNLTPCGSLPKPQDRPLTPLPRPIRELLRCAICGVKEERPAVNKFYGQLSCILCASFFTRFIEEPTKHRCVYNGDCLMTVDSRCQACWIKICLQKFHIDSERRKYICEEFSPKLSKNPDVSLITIDTSSPM